MLTGSCSRGLQEFINHYGVVNISLDILCCDLLTSYNYILNLYGRTRNGNQKSASLQSKDCRLNLVNANKMVKFADCQNL